ncbi:MAG: B12-binding domain-containing radical SAM protein [Endomicrobia bacterium]|nr:B12-binding domain-containing radical SAM protein [Endomicrobiia bacterium]
MKVLLVRPNAKVDSIVVPIGLAYLAAQIKDRYEVVILDCLKDNMSHYDFLMFVKKFLPDVVGLQVYHTDKEVALRYVKAVKEYKSSIFTVIGGPYSSCEDSNNIFRFFGKYLDYAFVGESEVGFKKLVEKLSGSKNFSYSEIEGLVYRIDGTVYKTRQVFVENLDVLNPPFWDGVKPQRYPLSPQGRYFKQYPICSINISRGCPYKCSFCAGYRITGNKVRYRSIENVVEEIILLYEKFGIKEFHIVDDNFTFDKEYVINFCKKIIELSLNITFVCPNGVRLDTLDDEVLSLMKKAGFYILHIGIESASNRILKYMHKGLNKQTIINKLTKFKKLGFDLCGYFIFGYPKERFVDRINNIIFALRLPLVGVMFMNFMPIPSTEAYEEFKFDNLKLYKKNFYSTFYGNFFQRIFLKFIQLFGMFVFYVRPKIFLKNMLYIKTFDNFVYLLRRILRMVITW